MPPVSRAQVKCLRGFSDPRLARHGLLYGARFTGSNITLAPQVCVYGLKVGALLVGDESASFGVFAGA